MNNALAAAGLFFLLSFHPHVATPVLLIAGTLSKGFNDFDNWLLDLIMKYDSPDDHVFYITLQKFDTEIAMLHFPASNELPDDRFKHYYGLVLIQSETLKAMDKRWILHYAFDLLVPGGKLLVLKNLRVLHALKKD